MKQKYICVKIVDCGMRMLKYFQLYWHKLSIITKKNSMENFNEKRKDSRELLKDSKIENGQVDGTLSGEDVIAKQGSEEQKMKEKYISEVSKIEDAPGNGGTENKEG